MLRWCFQRPGVYVRAITGMPWCGYNEDTVSPVNSALHLLCPRQPLWNHDDKAIAFSGPCFLYMRSDHGKGSFPSGGRLMYNVLRTYNLQGCINPSNSLSEPDIFQPCSRSYTRFCGLLLLYSAKHFNHICSYVIPDKHTDKIETKPSQIPTHYTCPLCIVCISTEILLHYCTLVIQRGLNRDNSGKRQCGKLQVASVQ